MARSRLRRTFRSRSRPSRATWRETRFVSSVLGTPCIPGMAAECTTSIDGGSAIVFPSNTNPCATILAYPVLTAADWQPIDGLSGNPGWKERVVHTRSVVNTTLLLNPVWVSSIARAWFSDIQTAVPLDWLHVPYRSCMAVFDDDELTDASTLESMYDDGWMERERVIPGTFRDGKLVLQGSIATWADAVKMQQTANARRRLETGESLYWLFEMGCVSYANSEEPVVNDMFAAANGPLWLQSHFRSSYVE